MDFQSFIHTAMSFVGVIIFMLLTLYGLNWLSKKTNFVKMSLPQGDIKIIDRVIIDSKRQIVTLQDKHFVYTLLLGENDLVLNKLNRHE